jgi:hypothetical protein
MIPLNGMRVRHDGPWLCHDARLKTLYPADHPARRPTKLTHFADAVSATNALSIDHGHLLDLVWKIRSAESLAMHVREHTGCERTRAIAIELSTGFFADVLSDIDALLARKAEAELWAEGD